MRVVAVWAPPDYQCVMTTVAEVQQDVKEDAKAALRDAQDSKRAFSWISTGLVCQHWSAAYAARGWWGRGHCNKM